MNWKSLALCLVLVLAVGAHADNWVPVYTSRWDVADSFRISQRVEWFQASTVRREYQFHVRGAPYAFPSNALVTWDVVAEKDNEAVYVVQHGTLGTQPGTVRFELSPDESNLPEGYYLGFINVWEEENGEVRQVDRLARQRIEVKFSTDSRAHDMVGPLTWFYGEVLAGGRLVYAGTNRYALMVRHMGSEAPVNGLLVTTPGIGHAGGILMHLLSKRKAPDDDEEGVEIDGDEEDGGEGEGGGEERPRSNLVSRFIVRADGLVGINVVNPQYPLHVAGDTRISGDLLMRGTAIKDPSFDPDSWGDVGFSNWGPDAWLRNASVKKLRVSKNVELRGSVGIGTTNYYAILNVVDPAPYASKYAVRVVSEGGNDMALGMLVNLPNATHPDAIIAHFASGPGGSNAPHSRLIIRGNGYVGIGTAHPESELDVAGTLDADAIGARLLQFLDDRYGGP